MFKELTYKPYGNKAILIEWPAKISEEIVADILQFKTKILAELSAEVTDAIMGYHSLTVLYNCSIDSLDNTIQELQNVYVSKNTVIQNKRTLWKIPVCYDEAFGLDLALLSEALQLSTEAIIQLHTQPQYTVYFIGFLPGFLYLGGLDERLTMPRKATPRLQVAKGSVAIGGSQTGIYPLESAGGWNLLGNTPISFFDPTLEQPCFAQPGDAIQFVPIPLQTYEKIQLEVEAGVYELENTLLDA